MIWFEVGPVICWRCENSQVENQFDNQSPNSYSEKAQHVASFSYSLEQLDVRYKEKSEIFESKSSATIIFSCANITNILRIFSAFFSCVFLNTQFWDPEFVEWVILTSQETVWIKPFILQCAHFHCAQNP